MVRKTIRKSVEKSQWRNYKLVADNFYNGTELAKEFEYWNAAGILIVHSAIAYTDAVCIKNHGIKSQGEDHFHAIVLLKELVTSSSENKRAFIQLEKIIEHKNRVSYNGEIYTRRDIDTLWKQLARYKDWADKLLA